MYKQNTKIVELVNPVVTAMGYELWGVEYLPQGRFSLLRIYIDKEGGITLTDCEQVSRQVTGVLDVADPIQGAYNLEVSSPGLDRPLFSLAQFARYIGSEVRLVLSAKLDGRRKFTGRITGTDPDHVQLEVEGNAITVPADAIDSARLVPDIDINKGEKRES